MSESAVPITIVAAAVVRDHRGRVLLARRPAGRHMAGLWEFPGGKLRAGEGPVSALRRELGEELGIDVQVGEPLTFALHEEPGLRILLLFFAATIAGGTPRALEGQELQWVEPRELPAYPTPPADAALVTMLSSHGRGPSHGAG
jgi:8-oxo-dGTP diphosphatase